MPPERPASVVGSGLQISLHDSLLLDIDDDNEAIAMGAIARKLNA